MKRLILASGSRQRKLIMDALGIAYEVIPANLDEKAIHDTDPAKRAQKLAKAKAEKVAAEHQGIILAADTFAVNNGRVLEKPVDIDEAREMLTFQSGKSFQVITGFCYLDKESGIAISQTDIVETTMRQLPAQEIEEFIHKYPVTTWSAAFAPAYPYQMTFISSIEGSLTSFIYGLPMEKIVPLLHESGFVLNPKPLE